MCSLPLEFCCSWTLSEKRYRKSHTHTHTHAHTHTYTHIYIQGSFYRVPASFPLFIFITLFFSEKPGSHYPQGIHPLLGPSVYKIMSWPHFLCGSLFHLATAQCSCLPEPTWPSSFGPLPCGAPPPHLATTMLCCLPPNYEFLKLKYH